METLVLSVHIALAVCLVILVLLQQGKGADMGAVMGSGGANSLFGVSGASNLLVKMTTSIAVAFMLTSVLLVRFAAGRAGAALPSSDPLQGSALGGIAAAVSTTTVTAEPAGAVAEGQGTPPTNGAPAGDSALGDTKQSAATSPEIPAAAPVVPEKSADKN